MNLTSEQKKALVAIIFIGMMQMIGVGLSPMLADMAKAFPQASAAQIQLVSTLPNLFVILASFLAARLSFSVRHKYLTAFGSALAVLFALCGFCLHGSLGLLYLWSVVLGVGVGFTNTIGTVLINELFQRDVRVNVMGLQAFAASIGTMMMTFAGGRLVRFGWNWGYLVYLLAIPGVILSLTMLPACTAPADASVSGARPVRWGRVCFVALAAFTSALVYNICNTNLSMLLEQENLGTAQQAGVMLSLIMLASGLTGLIVGPVQRRLHLYTVVLAYGLVCAGYGIVFAAPVRGAVLAGGVISGCAVSLFMPTLVTCAADCGGTRPAMTITCAMTGSYAGSLVSPVTTPLAAALFGSPAVRWRYLTGALLDLVFAAAACAAIAAMDRQDEKQKQLEEN